MARQVDLAVFSDDRARSVDDDRGVEVARAPVLLGKFRIADIKADAEFGRRLEKRARLRPGISRSK
jgi:hypothetical protein